jgi:NTP pyrophosphatase (non-canonical NTP hydrolase)
MSQGLGYSAPDDVGEQLADVVITAAILARQLGVDLDKQIESKLGSPGWQSQF